MKLSVFYPHILDAAEQTGRSIPEILSVCRDLGIKAVEIDAPHLSPELPHLSMIQEAGLEVACVNCFYALDKVWEEDTVAKHIQYCIRSGAKKMLIVPGFLEPNEADVLNANIYDKEKVNAHLKDSCTATLIRDRLDKIVKMASVYGIRIVIEDFDNACSPISSINGLSWYLDQVEGLYCCFDTGNFITHNEDPLLAWEALKDKIIHIHCKDRGEGPMSVGAGNIPFPQLMDKATAAGYSGILAIEHYGAPDQLSTISASAKHLTENYSNLLS